MSTHTQSQRNKQKNRNRGEREARALASSASRAASSGGGGARVIREDGACGVEGGIDLRSDWEGGRAGVNMAEGASAGPSTNSEFGSQMIAAACDGNEQELCRILDEGTSGTWARVGFSDHVQRILARVGLCTIASELLVAGHSTLTLRVKKMHPASLFTATIRPRHAHAARTHSARGHHAASCVP